MKQLLSFALLAAVGCVDPGEPAFAPEPSESSDTLPDDAVVYETVVTLGPDGAHVGEPQAVTVGAQRRQQALRLAAAHGLPDGERDYGCGGSSFWFFARMDWTGDKVCFKGCGIFRLGEISRYVSVGGVPIPIGNWILSSGSYWAGAESGVLVGGSGSYAASWIPVAPWTGKGRFNLGNLTIDGLSVGRTVQGEQCP